MEAENQAEWEIDNELGIQRLKIFGGWLVKRNENFMIKMPGKLIGTENTLPVNGMLAMTFVPDPKHEWTFEKGKVKNDKIDRSKTQKIKIAYQGDKSRK